MRRVRDATIAAVSAVVLALAVVSAAPGAGTEEPGAVTIPSVPKVSIGDSITINGYVSDGSVRIAGIDVTVKLYTLPGCASGASPRTVLTSAADGTFSYTETIAYTPPLSYGFIIGLSRDPTRAPNYLNGPDSCVTLEAEPKLSGKAEGSVTVDGSEFSSGVIGYGRTVDVGAGASVKLSTDVGRFRFFPVAGEGTSFVPVRVALPTPKGKKRRFIIELRLAGGDFSTCKASKKTQGFRTEAAKKPPPRRTLWGNGKGNYRTRGQYSSATVRGTSWLVIDLCGGTLTVVRSGSVQVRDFVKKKTVLVTAGHRYLAAPR